MIKLLKREKIIYFTTLDIYSKITLSRTKDEHIKDVMNFYQPRPDRIRVMPEI
jgi:hypothetical protein